MDVFSTRTALSAALALRAGVRGFVPTMGALHAGHISLVEQCRRACDTVVVSIFVNPTQFNDPADLKNYPRTVEADLAALEKAGVDFVYLPAVVDIYPEPDTRHFDFGLLDQVMEGRHRPGHFNGVAQVVSRLFEIVEPQRAYFGEKDFQQLAIIRTLVHQLGLSVTIIGCPIVRDTDGLALSSRNALLTPEHRAAAPAIYAALSEGATRAGTCPVAELEAAVIARIEGNALLKVEYFQIVNAQTLEPLTAWSLDTPTRGCITVQAGAVRLIDNVDFTPCK